jgi:hypothetical protein
MENIELEVLGHFTESSAILNELYLKRVSTVDEVKLANVLDTTISKKMPKLLSKEFEKVSKADLSTDEKVMLARKVPAKHSITMDRGRKGLQTMGYERQEAEVDGCLVYYYVDDMSDLIDAHVIVRKKKNDKIAIKRLRWRLHNSKKTVNA